MSMLVYFEGNGLNFALAKKQQCCSQCSGKQKSSGRGSAEIGMRALKCGHGFQSRKNGKMADECLWAQSVVEKQGKEERGVKGAGVFLWWLGVFLGQEDCGSGSEDNVDLSLVSNPCCPQPFCKLFPFCFRGQLGLCRAAGRTWKDGAQAVTFKPGFHQRDVTQPAAGLHWYEGVCSSGCSRKWGTRVNWGWCPSPAVGPSWSPTCFSPWVSLKRLLSLVSQDLSEDQTVEGWPGLN